MAAPMACGGPADLKPQRRESATRSRRLRRRRQIGTAVRALHTTRHSRSTLLSCRPSPWLITTSGRVSVKLMDHLEPLEAIDPFDARYSALLTEYSSFVVWAFDALANAGVIEKPHVVEAEVVPKYVVENEPLLLHEGLRSSPTPSAAATVPYPDDDDETNVSSEQIPAVISTASEVKREDDQPSEAAEDPAFLGSQVPHVIDMVFARQTVGLVLNVEPLRVEVTAMTASAWRPDQVLPACKVQSLICSIRGLCLHLHSIQAENAKRWGAPASKCPGCPRPVLPEDLYGEWCEYCYHNLREEMSGMRLAQCIACRDVVSGMDTRGHWCRICADKCLPLLKIIDD